jgi:hypothetical protein
MSTADRRSRPCKSETYPRTRGRPCTRSGIRSRRAHCSRVRASTRSPSCSATAVRPSHASFYVHGIADARRQTRRSRMTAEYAGALRVALDVDITDAPRQGPRPAWIPSSCREPGLWQLRVRFVSASRRRGALVLTIGTLGSSAGQLDYYERQVAAGAEDYYAGRGESPGVWIGSGLTALVVPVGSRVSREGFWV